MSPGDDAALFTLTLPRREPVDVPEPKRQDKSLLKLIGVHRRRLERLEWEAAQARQHWRLLRQAACEVRQEWRAARQHAIDFWAESRAEFFRMAISSGKFRTAKAVYERKKLDAEQVHLQAREAAQTARQAGRAYFDLKQQVRAGHLRSEKLDMLQTALYAKNNPVE